MANLPILFRQNSSGRGIAREGDPRGSARVPIRIKATYAERLRVVDQIDSALGGKSNVYRRDGVDRAKLELTSTPLGYGGHMVAGAFSKATVDRYLRRIRQDDQDAVDSLDEQIERAAQHLAVLRQARYDLLHEAWQRGNKVPLAEVKARAEAEATKENV